MFFTLILSVEKNHWQCVYNAVKFNAFTGKKLKKELLARLKSDEANKNNLNSNPHIHSVRFWTLPAASRKTVRTENEFW